MWDSVAPDDADPREAMIVVSCRLPATLRVERGAVRLTMSSRGLARAMRGPFERRGVRWVGWTGDHQEHRGDVRAAVEAELQRAKLAAVPVGAAEAKRFVEGFSNGVLWPLAHYLIDKVNLDAGREWEVYRLVNARFADAAAAAAPRGATVWIHDHPLMMVPAMLRARRPDLRIGFFLHTPFPAHEVFRVLPWRGDLLRGLLGADLVGFQTRDHERHFAACVAQVLGAEGGPRSIAWGERRVRTGAFPMGVDVDRLARAARSEECAVRVHHLREQARGRAIVLGVDRLDAGRGIPRTLQAVERFLETNPAMREMLCYVQVAVATREGVEGHVDYRRAIHDRVGRINGVFGGAAGAPVRFLHHDVGFDELVSLYRAADVMMATPPRDGMCAAAKEYCACRRDDSGVLVLSETSGAAAELSEALQINPYDTAAVAEALRAAIDMPHDEEVRRMRALREAVEANAVDRWAEGFLDALSGGVAG